MVTSRQPLWEFLISRDMKHHSSRAMTELAYDDNRTTSILARFCILLHCDVSIR
ncbi:MAG: hypothetical protein IKE94_11420 [Aeriscardovia sp.]|nr:hypothetical protein [Aeriscardovia sp.]